MKPSDFRWDYATKSFVFDGTTLWVVDRGNKQILQAKVQSSALPAAVSFLTGGSALSSQ